MFKIAKGSITFKQTISLSLFVLISLFISSCDTQKPMMFTIQHQQLLDVPSASGIVQVGGELYVVGDNSPQLYQLDERYQVKNRQLLIEGITDEILSKGSKPDFEAMTIIQHEGEDELLIFGSGSKSPERDIIARVRFKDGFHTKIYNADALYSELRSSIHLDAQSLNIEAAATIKNTLYLFNREHNLIVEYKLDEVLRFLENSKDLPNFKVYQIKLPQLNGLDAKFSGASAIPDSEQLVFTASVEDSPNTYDDGEVFGSYIGIINIEELKKDYEPESIHIKESGKSMVIKIESVEVIKVIGPKELKLVLVSDSDGGDSELLIGSLKW